MTRMPINRSYSWRQAGFRLAGSMAFLLACATAAVAQGPATKPPAAERGARAIRVEQAWIPMPDGVRLAVNLFLPEGATQTEKFPVILEYLPYRKDDWSAQRDYALHSYFVRRGYVSARVDIRGTGSSEGHPPDREYSEQEQLDGMEVIAWLARQPWSSGNVGMLGISWGGFNSIQMAMRRPPALKAIIAVDATDELFHDDIHYIDGLMHADEFEIGMDLSEMLTRAPDFPTDEASVQPRFENTPWFLLYLHQQRDGPFWRRASLRPDYSRINIPVFLIGGFLDGYRDSIPRMLEKMKTPVAALVGPWNHTFPHDAEPGPAIEWREDAVRWWDQWLKNRTTTATIPRATIFMRHWYGPGLSLKEIPGEWRTDSDWPPAGLQQQTLFLTPEHSLAKAGPAAGTHQLKYIPSAGVESGFWWGDLTDDQRPADAFSLVYDSPPLDSETAILGMPRAMLRVSSTAPLANWFVRLSDVAPDGSVTQVTGAGQSGAQRESSTNPKAINTGTLFPLNFDLHFTSWVFPKGHRVRVAVSNSAWPMIWPTPFSMTTTLALGGVNGSRIVLPVVPAGPATAAKGHPKQNFSAPAPDPHPPGMDSSGDTWPGGYHISRDPQTGTTRVDWKGNTKATFPWGKQSNSEELHYTVSDADPAVSSVNGAANILCELKGRTVEWRVQLELHSDAKNFYYTFTRLLAENDQVLRTKTWKETIPRDFQ